LNYQPQASANPSTPNHLASLWNSFWNSTASYLLKSSEPQISEKQDRTGKTWFYIYDPVTERTHRVGSESEAIAWMERNRY
jgi:hypothetical protein